MVSPDDKYEDPPASGGNVPADLHSQAADEDGEPYEDYGDEQAENAGGVQNDGLEDSAESIAEGMLPSINLPVIVALGRSYMSIKEILKLQPGQILELNKNPQEPVDLVVNGKVVARGELVDVEGRLAVRLIKIIE